MPASKKTEYVQVSIYQWNYNECLTQVDNKFKYVTVCLKYSQIIVLNPILSTNTHSCGRYFN